MISTEARQGRRGAQAAQGHGARSVLHGAGELLLQGEQFEQVRPRHRQQQAARQVATDIAMQVAHRLGVALDQRVDFIHARHLAVNARLQQLAEQLHALLDMLHMVLQRRDRRAAEQLA
jgi:hypothetical protein